MMKGNVLSIFFKHFSALCAGKIKSSLGNSAFQVYVDKNIN